jgi:heme-degrading monooxygenase HmoA
MIARVWHGYTATGNADAYEAMLKPELLPGIASIPGYKSSYLLRKQAGDEVEFEFVTIMLWDPLDAIRTFAGPEYEASVSLRNGASICPATISKPITTKWSVPTTSTDRDPKCKRQHPIR